MIASSPEDSGEREPVVEPPTARDAALEHVVDDLAARQECAEWAFEELSKGQTAEALTAELVSNGWGEEDAADLVEMVRRQTRDVRGVVTRDAVARDVNQRYRRTMGGWWVGMPLFAAGMRLIGAVRNFLAMRQVRRRKRDEQTNAEEE